MSHELLPCPFCGGDANAKPHSQHLPGCYFDAMAKLKAAHKGDLSMAPEVVRAWNRRATQPAAGEPATVDDLARRLFAAFAKAEPESGITLNPTSYWATFADMARAVLQDAPPAAAHGDDRVAGLRWVIARCAVMQEKGFERVLLKAFKRDLEVALDAMRAQAGEGGEV